jgi:sarcosine oxidase, subunit alpha
MSSLDFEGRSIPVGDGDTIAAALYRAGVRTFTRSLKYHRRRGLYCMTGDCPNCVVTVDDQPGTRACVTDAVAGLRVRREAGWPSADFDLLSIADRAHRLLPVGFYYKTFIRPSFAWPIAERLIRRTTGLGRLPTDAPVALTPARAVQVEVLVVGGGVAGLAAAMAASEDGAAVLVCDEGRLGERLAPGPAADRLRSLASSLRARPSVTILERHTALGVYDGPLVPIVGEGQLLRVEPRRIVVATGAVESHPLFRGNDLPGVWLGRGAARLAGVHGVRPGERAVVAANSSEGLEHMATLSAAGVHVAAAVVPASLVDALPPSIPIAIRDGSIVAAEGGDRVRAVRVRFSDGALRRIECDAVIASLGLSPRDGVLRLGEQFGAAAAGDVAVPGCSVDDAVVQGEAAGRGEMAGGGRASPANLGSGGFVCLCEDVSTTDLAQAWFEGWRSSELLKRYTTATMGPCQGALCARHLARFAAARATSPAAGARTTARPPARPVALEHLAGGIHEVIEKRTSLHDRHLRRALGVVGRVEAAVVLRRRRRRARGGPSPRGRDGRRNARQVPRRRARCDDAPRSHASLHDPRPRAGPFPVRARPR